MRGLKGGTTSWKQIARSLVRKLLWQPPAFRGIDPDPPHPRLHGRWPAHRHLRWQKALTPLRWSSRHKDGAVLRSRGSLPTGRFGEVLSQKKFLQHREDSPEVSEIVRVPVLAEPLAEVGLLVRIDTPFLSYVVGLTSDGLPVRLHDVDKLRCVVAGLSPKIPAQIGALHPL